MMPGLRGLVPVPFSGHATNIMDSLFRTLRHTQETALDSEILREVDMLHLGISESS